MRIVVYMNAFNRVCADFLADAKAPDWVTDDGQPAYYTVVHRRVILAHVEHAAEDAVRRIEALDGGPGEYRVQVAVADGLNARGYEALGRFMKSLADHNVYGEMYLD